MTRGPRERMAEHLRQAAAEASVADGDEPPARAGGTDLTGTIAVRLGADGLPESVSIGSGLWRALSPESFGAAVADAGDAALARRLAAALATPRRAGRSDRADGGATGAEPRPDPLATGGQPPWHLGLDGAGAGSPPAGRPLLDVVSELLETANAVLARQEQSPAWAATGTGFAGAGKLRLSLSADGSMECTADPDWVSRQDPDELEDALNRALASARAEVASVPPPDADPRPGELAAELLALLRPPAGAADRKDQRPW
jgi:hypothetical protein